MATDDEYITELREVRRPKDTQRSKSSKSAEFESDLLRDTTTRSVAGPTESRPFDQEAFRRQVRDEVTAELNLEQPLDSRRYEDLDSVSAPTRARELTPGQQALIEAVVDVAVDVTTTVVREVVAPFIRDVALPAARAKLDESAERRRAKVADRAESRALGAKTIELEVVEELDASAAATDVLAAEPSIRLSRSDFLRAQLELKLAEDYAERQRWLLAHADVANEDLPPELERSLGLILESRADELDEDQREVVAAFLGRAGDPSNTGPAIPIEREPDARRPKLGGARPADAGQAFAPHRAQWNPADDYCVAAPWGSIRQLGDGPRWQLSGELA